VNPKIEFQYFFPAVQSLLPEESQWMLAASSFDFLEAEKQESSSIVRELVFSRSSGDPNSQTTQQCNAIVSILLPSNRIQSLSVKWDASDHSFHCSGLLKPFPSASGLPG
jgi:ubiquinone biosynthesis protein COQ9